MMHYNELERIIRNKNKILLNWYNYIVIILFFCENILF